MKVQNRIEHLSVFSYAYIQYIQYEYEKILYYYILVVEFIFYLHEALRDILSDIKIMCYVMLTEG